MKWTSKINYVIMLPFSILRKATIPMVDRENWSKFWCVIASFCFIFIIALNFDCMCLFDGDDNSLVGYTDCLIPSVPNYILFIVIGGTVSTLTMIFTKASEVPHGVYGSFLMLLGFLTAANWTAKIADEIGMNMRIE